MAVKRSRKDHNQVDSTIAMANYLLMLSQRYNDASVTPYKGRVFECKTCNRQFPSFQALGGHRASHKRSKSSATHDNRIDHVTHDDVVVRSKVHECTICGSTFSIGQALGGHMRRHRGVPSGSQFASSSCSSSYGHPSLVSLSLPSYDDNLVVKRGIKDDGLMSLDLNLTPQENGLLDMKKGAPASC